MIFERFLKTKKWYVLFLLPFVAVTLAVINFYLIDEVRQPDDTMTMLPLHMFENISFEKAVIGGFVSVLLFAYLLFFLNARYKFLSQLTALPSLIYILLTAGLISVYGIGYLQMALLLLMIGFGGLQAAILDSKSNSPIFNLGFFVCSAVVVYPKFILMALWAVCVLFFSGRSTVKDVIALLLGFATVLFFTLFGYFWTDRLTDFIPVFQDNLLAGEFLTSLPYSETIRLGIWVLLLLLSLVKVISYYPISVVNQRRGTASLISLLFFLGLTVFLIPGIQMNFIYALSWPLAYLYAQYFILQRIGWINDLFFLLLVFSCFVQLV